MQNSADTLHWYEKTAVGLGMAAQSLVVTRWYLDGVAPPSVTAVLVWVTVVVAVLAGVAFDAVVVVTTMSRREGRQSWWGIATAGAAAVFSAAVALHMYGGWSAGPWLHVGYPVITFLFVQHLAAPKKAAVSEVEQLTGWLEQERAETERLKAENEWQAGELERGKVWSEQLRFANEQQGDAIEQAQQIARKLEYERDQFRSELEQALSSEELDRKALAQAMSNAGMTDRQIAPLLSISTGTLSNWRKSNGKAVEVLSHD